MSGSEVRDMYTLIVLALYLVVAVIELGLFLLFGLRSFPVGVLAVLGLGLAYGFFKMRRWAVLLSVILFFPRLAFGVIGFYAYVELLLAFGDLLNVLMLLIIAIYTASIFITLVYTVSKREVFQ